MAKMNAEKLAAWERKRDLNAELLEAIREVKTGRTGHVWRIERRADGTLRRKLVLPVAEIRKRTALSQSEFASVLGVSVRTLQDWEQGRREPSGAARTLLAIASRHPGVLMEAVAA
jgi:putative transcriptional regulator